MMAALPEWVEVSSRAIAVRSEEIVVSIDGHLNDRAQYHFGQFGRRWASSFAEEMPGLKGLTGLDPLRKGNLPPDVRRWAYFAPMGQLSGPLKSIPGRKRLAITLGLPFAQGYVAEDELAQGFGTICWLGTSWGRRRIHVAHIATPSLLNSSEPGGQNITPKTQDQI